MISITHIRVNKTDKELFKRFARNKKLTSSKAFSLLLKRSGVKR